MDQDKAALNKYPEFLKDVRPSATGEKFQEVL